MSKKKAATTMRLKDFHGGSIPSDLPLPSAPGAAARPTQERPTSLPSRPDRSRHAASPHASTSPLPAPPRMIGRHFDEDERTPFDAPPQRPAPAIPTGAWAARKDQSSLATCPVSSSPTPTVWSPSKVAQASAVEKVISGRWLSTSSSNPADSAKPKSDAPAPPLRSMSDVWAPPVINQSEPVDEINPLIRAHRSGFERPVARSGVIGENRVLKSPVNQETKSGETKAGLEEFHPFRQGYFGNNWEGERPKSVGARSAVDLEGREIGRPVSHEGRFGEERPRLRLLPRSKKVESRVVEEGRTVILEEKKGNGDEEGGEGNERPRLNLKPRSKTGDDESGGKRYERIF